MKNLIALGSVAILLTLSACTKKDETAAAPSTATTTTTTTTTAAAVDQNAKPDVDVVIGSKGNEIAFDKTEFKVKAGQIVRITMKNNSTADANMLHNVVVTMPGTETQVENDGIQAGEANDWVQAGPNVIAHTALAKAGESKSVTFRAPAAGDYTYVCTFPGHASMMRGTMKVE